jgi:hypothetical protein
MPNPNPKLENLKHFDRADESSEVLSSKAISIKLPKDVDAVLRKHPQKSAWLRRVIVEAARRELMPSEE